MLEARVKQDYNLNTVTAFSGLEFLKREWRPVPERYAEAAKAHDLLEVREAGTQFEYTEGYSNLAPEGTKVTYKQEEKQMRTRRKKTEGE